MYCILILRDKIHTVCCLFMSPQNVKNLFWLEAAIIGDSFTSMCIAGT